MTHLCAKPFEKHILNFFQKWSLNDFNQKNPIDCLPQPCHAYYDFANPWSRLLMSYNLGFLKWLMIKILNLIPWVGFNVPLSLWHQPHPPLLHAGLDFSDTVLYLSGFSFLSLLHLDVDFFLKQPGSISWVEPVRFSAVQTLILKK